MLDLDELCLRLSLHAGVRPDVSALPVPDERVAASLERMGLPAAGRLVQLGRIEALVMSLPPMVGTDSRPRSVQDAARDIARNIGYLHRYCLPQRQWGRIAVLQLEDGWKDPELLASCLERDSAAVMKFAVHSAETPEDVFDRIPAVAPLWHLLAPESPAWLSSIACDGAMGPFSEVSLHLHAGPGITLLSGGNGTGKSLLLAQVRDALRGGSSSLDVLFADGRHPSDAAERFIPGTPHQPEEPDVRMPAFRRLMGYGDRQGELFLPLAMEGNAAQRMERVGRALFACVDAGNGADSWPGIALDCPTTGLDDIRSPKLIELIVRLAQHRQVVVAERDSQFPAFWQTVARDWGVPCSTVDLRTGKAVLPEPMAPVPASSP
jgi:hypothetical protein